MPPVHSFFIDLENHDHGARTACRNQNFGNIVAYIAQFTHV